MAFTCPHCGAGGISLLAKLISAASTWNGWCATCRRCRQRSSIAAGAVHTQFGIFLLGLATIPWIFAGSGQLIAVYIAAAVILTVGFFAPMRKRTIGG